jgi:putative DNA primase/helicase
MPVPNAKLFLSSEFAKDDVGLLVYHLSVFRTWDEAAWRAVEEIDLTSKLFDFFEYAVYMVETKDGLIEKRFKPTPTKVKQLVETLRAITNLGRNQRLPSWLVVNHPLDPGDIIPMANGLLLLPDRILIAPTPVFFNSYSLAFEYVEKPPYPERWHRFLVELFGNDVEAIRLLQEWMGYQLIPDTSQHKILLMHGPPRAGKGTIGRVIEKLLGEDNVASVNLSDFSDPHGMHQLVDKQAVIIPDGRMPKGKETTTAVERLLSIAGEDRQSVNPKFRDRYSIRLKVKVTMMTNELPRLVDSSTALDSRLLVLRFTRSFLNKEDHGLDAALEAELPGILDWALDGLDALRDRGHFLQPGSGQALITDLAAMSSPISAFIDECCIVGPDERVAIDVLYGTWTDWCGDNGHIPGSKNVFTGKLRAVVPELEVVRGSGTPRKREYVGIGLV